MLGVFCLFLGSLSINLGSCCIMSSYLCSATKHCNEDLVVCVVTNPKGQSQGQACIVPNAILLHKVMVQIGTLVNFLWKTPLHVQETFSREKRKRHDLIWNVISCALYLPQDTQEYWQKKRNDNNSGCNGRAAPGVSSTITKWQLLLLFQGPLGQIQIVSWCHSWCFPSGEVAKSMYWSKATLARK